MIEKRSNKEEKDQILNGERKNEKDNSDNNGCRYAYELPMRVRSRYGFG